MKYRNPQLLDELAARYALGTLRGPARTRFERIFKDQPAAQLAVHRWEDRFMSMTADIVPVQPPASVWREVQRRLGHSSRATQTSWIDKLLGWATRPQLALAASLAAIAFTIAITTFMFDTKPTVIATFVNNEQVELWRIEANNDGDELVVTGTQALALEANRDYELWALPDSGAAPVSLGLMPWGGQRDLRLTAAQRSALNGASKIAISLEPLGGSTTGAPTGPVLYVTAVTRAS